MAKTLSPETVEYIAAGNGNRVIWRKWESKITLMTPDCCGLCVIPAKGGTLNVRIVRKQQAIYPAFCQTLGERLAEMVANSPQVSFKLVTSCMHKSAPNCLRRDIYSC